ncbi:MAG TPA: 50S ribosomal protein L3 N(5)-glutamine methyltransferase [Gammaproteobacteria bacterium]|jgi:ribosomal protein L3 glutamine methyltransferase|nr:50S ribosomal protein L3 N(5)-glutamine methyltransferase [Gammaproteobacteria bacterium]
MNQPAELKTIRDFLRYATSVFNEADLYYGHGTDNAWDEAVALILHTLHLPHDINAAVLDAQLIEKERQAIFQLIHRRITERIPVAYLTHEAWFNGLSFYVDERVLIPRSSIAELIEEQFQPWIEVDRVHHILDLCTGSGCIAIACAKAFPEAIIDASDISEEALAVAKINALKHFVDEQVHLHQSDLFNTLPIQQYDIIISNPPYVGADEMAILPKEYHHEPAIGLEAGEDGLDYVVQIMREAKHYLKPKGLLIVEVGNSEAALMERFPDLPFTWMTFKNGDTGVFLLTAEELRDMDITDE